MGLTTLGTSYVCFCDWLISLSRMPWRLIHVVALSWASFKNHLQAPFLTRQPLTFPRVLGGLSKMGTSILVGSLSSYSLWPSPGGSFLAFQQIVLNFQNPSQGPGFLSLRSSWHQVKSRLSASCLHSSLLLQSSAKGQLYVTSTPVTLLLGRPPGHSHLSNPRLSLISLVLSAMHDMN